MTPLSQTLDLACSLLKRPSITPQNEGCLELVTARLRAIGFICERMDAGNTCNLWARRGHGQPLVCLAGHVDVVPPGDFNQWFSPPFEPTIHNENLVCRGAADMKTSLAAFVTAVERFVVMYPEHPGSLAFLLTSDEEGEATYGTIEVVRHLQKRGERLDFCIVGEPTSNQHLGDMIKNGRRGSLSGRLIIHGQQGHIAYPHLAQNPIHLFSPALAELVRTEWDSGNVYFPPTSFQVSNIHAGMGTSNVIPGMCEVLFNFRFAPTSSAETLKARTHAILDAYGFNYTLDWTLSGEPFLTPQGTLVSAISDAILDETGRRPELSTSGGTSDGRFIATICDEVIEFGPINATIHKVNECIAMADIEPLSRIYEKTLAKLLFR